MSNRKRKHHHAVFINRWRRTQEANKCLCIFGLYRTLNVVFIFNFNYCSSALIDYST